MVSKEKRLIALFNRYQSIADSSWENNFPSYDKCSRDHIIQLCDTAVQGIIGKKFAYGKLCRWLGFVQGVLAACGLIVVDEERDFTRPIFKGRE